MQHCIARRYASGASCTEREEFDTTNTLSELYVASERYVFPNCAIQPVACEHCHRFVHQTTECSVRVNIGHKQYLFFYSFPKQQHTTWSSSTSFACLITLLKTTTTSELSAKPRKYNLNDNAAVRIELSSTMRMWDSYTRRTDGKIVERKHGWVSSSSSEQHKKKRPEWIQVRFYIISCVRERRLSNGAAGEHKIVENGRKSGAVKNGITHSTLIPAWNVRSLLPSASAKKKAKANMVMMMSIYISNQWMITFSCAIVDVPYSSEVGRIYLAQSRRKKKLLQFSNIFTCRANWRAERRVGNVFFFATRPTRRLE